MPSKIDLNSPGITAALSKRILEDIDEYCATEYDDGHRSHLGASQIGKECCRYLWYVFRWCFKEKFDGRMQRLFNRGHREEARFIEWLQGIGAQVWAVDENGEQFRISGVNGHFGGSLDGICILPERYNIAEPLLLEFKTNGTGQAFNKLRESGLQLNKPEHFAQTSTYGFKGVAGTKFNFVLYLNINKNDDTMHCEVAKLDHKLGQQMEQKAERIILSQTPPARLSDNPTFHKCQYCAMKGICHKGEPPEKNCRSCAKASPVENKEWFCSEYNAVIPKEHIATGCNVWESITK